MTPDPLAAYHDRLNATVLEALVTIQQQVQTLSHTINDLQARLTTDHRITMDNAQRIISLERTSPRWVPVVEALSALALALAAWGGFVLALVVVLGGPQ